jgi:hypothetical protein
MAQGAGPEFKSWYTIKKKYRVVFAGRYCLHEIYGLAVVSGTSQKCLKIFCILDISVISTHCFIRSSKGILIPNKY